MKASILETPPIRTIDLNIVTLNYEMTIGNRSRPVEFLIGYIRKGAIEYVPAPKTFRTKDGWNTKLHISAVEVMTPKHQEDCINDMLNYFVVKEQITFVLLDPATIKNLL